MGTCPSTFSYVHEQTATGMGNYVPRIGYDEVRLRLYIRLWGRHAAVAPSPSPTPPAP